jgi:RNA polymerase sigma-70 factor (ECF subfamily)
LDWEQVYDEHGPALLLYARQWAVSPSDAEDAVQEAFVEVYRKQRDPEAVVGLLYRAAKWRALDLGRRRRRRRDREARAHADAGGDAVWFERSLEQDERRQAVERAVQALPPEQREVLVLRIWGGLTFRQAAEALDIPPGTAASRYRLALKTLAQTIPTDFAAEVSHASA